MMADHKLLTQEYLTVFTSEMFRLSLSIGWLLRIVCVANDSEICLYCSSTVLTPSILSPIRHLLDFDKYTMAYVKSYVRNVEEGPISLPEYMCLMVPVLLVVICFFVLLFKVLIICRRYVLAVEHAFVVFHYRSKILQYRSTMYHIISHSILTARNEIKPLMT